MATSRWIVWVLVISLLSLTGVGEGFGQESIRPASQLPDGLRFAHGLFRQRKFELAAEEYLRFLETDPEPLHADDARFGLASSYLLQGRYQESRAAFQEFLRQSPDHPRTRTARYRLGELSYMLGDLPVAREALERFTSDPAEHPNLETAWTYLGDVQSALNDPATARLSYERSLQDFPNARLADRARYGLGRALAALGQTQQALDVLNDLIDRKPAEWVEKARLQVGKIELAAGRFKDAEATLALVNGPGALESEAHLRRGQALIRLDRLDEAVDLLQPLADDPSEPTSIEAGLDAASVDLRRDRPEAALRTLDAALLRAGSSPLAPALLYRSAEALRALGRSAEARERFLKVAETAPDDPWADDAWLEAVRLAHQTGGHDTAESLAREFAAKFPSSKLLADVRLIQGRSANASQRFEAAVAALEPLLPPDAETSSEILDATRYELAQAYRALGDGEKADAVLAALAKSPRTETAADAAFLLGGSHLEAGRFAEAVAEFDRYLDASPDGRLADHALAQLVAAHLGRGERADAAKAVETLASRFPDSSALPTARLRLAESSSEAGDLTEAVALFRLIVAPDSLAERAEMGLARALAKLGEAAEAAKVFDGIVSRTTNEAEAASLAFERAQAVEASGDRDAAVVAYEKVETLAPMLDTALHATIARARLLEEDHPQEAADLLGRLVDGDDARARLKAIDQPVDALIAQRGWALLDVGDIEKADHVFTELLDEFPDSPFAADARFNLAESANERQDYERVVTLLAPLVDPEGSNPPVLPDRLAADVLYRLGRTRIVQKDWPNAAATLDRLLTEAPASPHAREGRFLRAEAALRQDQFETAEQNLAELIAAPTSPDDPPNLVELARERQVQCLLGLKRWKDAFEKADAFLQTLAEGPARDQVVFAQGRALLGLGRMDEARTAFQAVIDSRKSGDLAAQAQLMRGEAYFHEDQFLQALREFLQVDVLYDAPRRQAAALLEAGKVYERLARWADAVDVYNDLASRFPDDPCAAEAESRRDSVLTDHPIKP